MPRTDRAQFWLDKITGSDNFYICWYDAASRRTKRQSTGTADAARAQIKLAEHVLANAAPTKQPKSEAQIAVLLHHWNLEHGSKVASKETNAGAVSCLLEEFGVATLDKLTPERQETMVGNLRARGWKDSTVNRTVTVLRAAVRHAWKKGRIESMPFIAGVVENEPKAKYLFSFAEMAEFLERCYSLDHLFRFTMLAMNTLARSGAILDLTPLQISEEHGFIDLNPAGRKQNKKYRPLVPITRTLAAWLPHWPGSPVVNWNGRAIADIGKSFTQVGRDMKLPQDVTPYCIRHTMATWLAKSGAPKEERDRYMGHKARDGSQIGERYVHFEPIWLAKARDAIDDYFAKLPVHFNLWPVPPPKLEVVVGAGIEPAAFPMSRGHSTAELTDRAQVTRKGTSK